MSFDLNNIVTSVVHQSSTTDPISFEDRVILAKQIVEALRVAQSHTADFIFENMASKKIECIKELRSLTGLGLKAAKDAVEGMISPIVYRTQPLSNDGEKKAYAHEVMHGYSRRNHAPDNRDNNISYLMDALDINPWDAGIIVDDLHPAQAKETSSSSSDEPIEYLVLSEMASSSMFDDDSYRVVANNFYRDDAIQAAEQEVERRPQNRVIVAEVIARTKYKLVVR